jgi:hypothetical protein
MTETHERELGEALRKLDVPEHAPEFDAELRRRLRERGLRRRTWALAIAAALAVLGASAVALFVPRGSAVASAADVREAISEALGSAHTITGVFVNQEVYLRDQLAYAPANRWRFEFRSSGSFRITGLGRNNPTDLEYDPGLNVEAYSDLGLFVWRVGLAPGWPDSAPAGWVLRRDLGSVVAALAADPDAKVAEVEYGGRPAWRLRTPTGNALEEREITVDRETGIPVRDRLLHNGRFAGEWRIEGLRVNAGRTEVFKLQPREGQKETTYDMGFRRMSLERAASVVGYRPLVPAWVPPGFELGEVAVARRSRPTGDEQRQNPPSRNVVSLRYQRGLDHVVVTTRLSGDPSRWGDPVIGSSVRSRPPERVEFTAGALDGHSGELVIDPNSVPHVWAIAGGLVVTIAGNADRDELLRIAESLER